MNGELPSPFRATFTGDGALLVEMAAREAGRRLHKPWKRVPANALVQVLKELGFKLEVTSGR